MKTPDLALVLGALLLAGCASVPVGDVPAAFSAPSVALPAATRVLGQATVYISATGEKLEIVNDPRAGIAIVKLPDGDTAILPAEIADTEGRYRDNRMTIWEYDGVALLWIDGKLVFNGKMAK